MRRLVSWFSCGAASAVATKIALAKYEKVNVVCCEIAEEHPDNKRFLKDCEDWFGQKIEVLGNDKYNRSVYEVIKMDKYLVGVMGARCTLALKKGVRESYQKPDDLHIFGYTVEETERLNRFIDANNGIEVEAPLIDEGLTKADCLGMLDNVGIEIPMMYKLGYNNNNCVGCVKGGMGYWNKIRVDFPDTFKRMSEVERWLGRTILKSSKDGVTERIFLDELDPSAGRDVPEPEMSCGFNCEFTSRFYELED